MKEPRLVEVHWHDSQGGGGWKYREDLKELNLTVRSVGFIVGETPAVLMLSAHLAFGGEQVHSVMSIPKVAIQRVRRIKI